MIWAVIGCITISALWIWKTYRTKTIPLSTITIAPTPSPTPDPLSPKNILLLGYGGGNHEGGLLTDTIVIAHIDPKTREVILISVPRDLWVPLPLVPNGTVYKKINASYAEGFNNRAYPDRPTQYTGKNGGANLAAYAATAISGLPIDGYVAVSFEGFKNVIHSLGTISVQVPYTFEDKFYPIEGKETDMCGIADDQLKLIEATVSGELVQQYFTCRFETIKFEKGIQNMDADTALKFVRSRHSETHPGDFYRSMRQQALIRGVISQLKTIGGIIKIPVIFSQIATFISTDISVTQLLDVMHRYNDPLNFQIQKLSLTTDNVLKESISDDGQYILTPKDGTEFELVKRYIQSQIDEIAASASAKAADHK